MEREIQISILMPVKNAIPFLKECLDSIIAQGYENWELIAVNDHSTDGTYTLLEEYEQKDDRIRIYQNNGQGIIHALRTGYQKSSGIAITRMDADDIMHPNKLEWMHRLLKINGHGYLVLGLVKYISDKPLGEGYLKYESWLNQLSLTERNFEEIYKECVVPSPCWMLYKTDLEMIGHFASDIYPEDYELCFRFRRAGFKIKTVKEKIHFWRDHPNRSSRQDPNYTDNRFLELKTKYFLEDDYQSDKPLLVWGAGKKGKLITKLLKDKGISFRWFTNNQNKIGHTINEVKLEEVAELERQKNSQLIIAIAEKGFKIDFLSNKKVEEPLKIYFFC